ncbi:MAG: redoxin domain-containing protein [Myxococcales bacterium]|nr:redoxin domain-containing protein [Myxococcales bacterium]
MSTSCRVRATIGGPVGTLLSLLTLAGLIGCSGEPPKAAQRTERFESVKAPDVKKDAVDAFCDTHDESEAAPAFQWPEMDGQIPATGGWIWVNAWATWCGPCVAEMPMLTRWKERLEKEGLHFTLAFLSLDSTAADVTRWSKAHADIPVGLRIANFGLVAAWLPSNGLNANASIPLQFFVDGKNKVRCTRMGAISEPDYSTVKQILSR